MNFSSFRQGITTEIKGKLSIIFFQHLFLILRKVNHRASMFLGQDLNVAAKIQ